MAPVKNGYIKYTDLLNGGLTIFDIEKMNEAIGYYVKLEKTIAEFWQKSKPEINKKNGRKIR